ncbi:MULTISPECIES: hypothetical protein [unclassified Streptomyces]|uniref:hypothetical protein n=1 Tax=unclassified Streptomyces TaxID=2593676 RepID=UPI003824C2A9
MPARTHARPHVRTHTRTQPRAVSDPAGGGLGMGLPWWCVALPVVAFAVLFILVADPAQAHAVGDDSGLGRFAERIWMTLAR